MTSKLEALVAIRTWMGAYESRDTLEAVVQDNDTEQLAEFPADMVAGYKLACDQVTAEVNRLTLIKVSREIKRLRPNWTATQIGAEARRVKLDRPETFDHFRKQVY